VHSLRRDVALSALSELRGETPEKSLFCCCCGSSTKGGPTAEEETDFSERVLCSDGSCVGSSTKGECVTSAESLLPESNRYDPAGDPEGPS